MGFHTVYGSYRPSYHVNVEKAKWPRKGIALHVPHIIPTFLLYIYYIFYCKRLNHPHLHIWFRNKNTILCFYDLIPDFLVLKSCNFEHRIFRLRIYICLEDQVIKYRQLDILHRLLLSVGVWEFIIYQTLIS